MRDGKGGARVQSGPELSARGGRQGVGYRAGEGDAFVCWRSTYPMLGQYGMLDTRAGCIFLMWGHAADQGVQHLTFSCRFCRCATWGVAFWAAKAQLVGTL